ncbi:MAG: ATP-binding protein [bacterium]|nr:ATP-binding protein [Candidatus Limimorpha caballi]
MRTGQKYYLSDVGLRTMLLGLRGGDLGRLLENIVYLHLIRSGHKVMVGKSGDKEIDFIRFKDGLVEYYQVALTVRDEQTLTREIAPLNSVKDHNPKFLLTMDSDPEISHNGIRQIYALDWLARQ